jgi:hypothetical protein
MSSIDDPGPRRCDAGMAEICTVAAADYSVQMKTIE